MLKVAGYDQPSPIYTGTRTVVYRGRRISDNRSVIIKILRDTHPTFRELVQFRNQYTITRHLNHPAIVQPLALERYKNSYALIMPDEGAIALSEYWQPSHPLSDFLPIAQQLADALHYLSQQRIIHKDIKPSNILIHPQTQHIKLIDFSISSLLPKEQQQLIDPNSLEGTLAYIAPEQTGRMNRGIDYRSDFYSLGVTLFELLTGELPFPSNDPLELIHCHIAQPVQFRDKTIPEALQAILCKLMAKNAEDRYQSALGLQQDLAQCLQQLNTTGEIIPFELGTEDRCDRFLIPEKLYGRETQVQTLLNAFHRVSHGKTEMMLVAGYSGVGKTAVINEVHKPIVKKRGHFIKGKFDQFNRNIPFSAFIQAFRDLMGQLLSASDTELADWKQQILTAVGENGQVLIDVIPELENIIGPQPPVPQLSGNAAQQRFNLLFGQFVRVFTTPQHPLTLFLDDLQWADLASLNLLQLILDESVGGYLLLLGAYRDNEVSPTHPLILKLAEMQKESITINTLTLTPLNTTDINRLVADTLLSSFDSATPLSQLVYQKTQGNPFFTTQFLKGLQENGHITFNREAGYWECDLNAVRQLVLTEDVVAFMAQRLRQLPPETQQALKLAACVGNQFDLNTLALIAQKSVTDTANALWPSLQEGLILPQSDGYKFYFNYEKKASQGEHNLENITYRFLHDRIQQAAYSLIPKNEQQATHYHIGNLLLNASNSLDHDERLFTIVSHLNASLDLIQQHSEPEKLAQLNLKAGKKAKTATAYAAALEYLQTGISLLNTDCWQSQYNLSLELYANATEAAYLNADFEQVQTYAENVLNATQTLSQQVKIYEIQIQVLVAQSKFTEALELGLQVLEHLGIKFPKNPTQADIAQGLKDTQALWENREIEELINLPLMTDGEQLAAMQILLTISAVAYLSSPFIYILIVFQQIQLSVKYGNTIASTYAYVAYGLLLCSLVEDVDLACRFGQLSLQLLNQLNAQELRCTVYAMFNFFIQHRKAHLRTTLKNIQEGYFIGLETGDVEFASYAALCKTIHLFFVGEELSTVEQDLNRYLEGVKKLKRQNTVNYYQLLQQTIKRLQQPAELSQQLVNHGISATIPPFIEETDKNGNAYFSCYQMLLCYLLSQPQQALHHAQKATQYLDAVAALFFIPIFYFYDSLIKLALYQDVSPTEQETFLNHVANNQEKLQHWAYHAPMNHQHKWELVEGERYRVLQQNLEAMECYDRAITGAKQNQYLQEEALANEKAAQFYLQWGKEKIAALYLQDAYYCYACWGSEAKTDQLTATYPELLAPILQKQQFTINNWNSLENLTQTVVSNSQVSNTSTGISDTLDLTSILQAAQALSRTLDLKQLLTEITRIILTNGGAQKAALFTPQGEDWQLRASAQLTADGTITTDSPDGLLPLRLLQYVKNTQESVIIDAAQTEISGLLEGYLLEKQPQSVLCVPLLNQGKLVAILYLEHPTTKGIFTPNRQRIIQFLAAQGAIALENAQLYQQAQDALQDLKQAQLQIVQSEKMSTLGNLVAGVAHEINNPTSFLQGNIEPAQEYVQDLLGLIDLYQEKTPQPDPDIEDEIEAIDLDFVREDLPKLLQSMKLGVERIRNISRSLRTFSRQDQDHKIPFNIHEGIDSTLLILKPRIKATDQHPEVAIIKQYQNIPPVHCFPGQLNQVFMNIIANALDAFEDMNKNKTYAEIEANPNSLTILTRQIDAKQVEIAIQDNGEGMNEDIQSRIFEQGFTTKIVGKGTGLGLAIAQQIVTEKHNGILTCDSQPGKGTTFSILLPIEL